MTPAPDTSGPGPELGLVTGLAAESKLIERAFARTGRGARQGKPGVACDGPGPERAQG